MSARTHDAAAASPEPTLTASQEFALYHSDRPAWLRVVAPRMAKRLREGDRDYIADTWASLPRDYQRAVWAVADAVTHEAIRGARLPEIRTVPNCPMPEREPDLFGLSDAGMPA